MFNVRILLYINFKFESYIACKLNLIKLNVTAGREGVVIKITFIFFNNDYNLHCRLPKKEKT